ncbi:MAG: hypothetical protein DI530_12115 [Sphingomonas sp.]|uniref:hypothetical protein n=1 Tax=Sphingomonas sp. TaxID=28214 RepID=UPI000DBC3566|nr:hypothetical protein [Sphingomonas sp.]PZU77733.1 MAG: hypothetical protein DI530_12115 [Sphingomonas sp.]
MSQLEQMLDLIERAAVAIARGQGHDFNERCGLEDDPTGECNSDTCVSAYYEDHDALLARDQYRKDARAALSAITIADLTVLAATDIPTTQQTIDLATGEVIAERTVAFTLMPAAPGLCAECATKHDPEQPHDANSLHYQYHFYGNRGRWPDWRDAMAHCADQMRADWTEALTELGVDVAAGKLRP